MLSPDEVDTYRSAAARAYDELDLLDSSNQMSRQIVQVWKSDPTLRELTTHAVLASLATELAGMPIRLWYDQLLIKEPHNHTPTEFHTDEFRFAMVNIYIDAEATYNGNPHVCTDGLGLQVGQLLPDTEFPRLP